jgi:DMSO/TMAO reductase YedYZ molybdopterin-dependent catalytic subunit
VTIRDNSGVLDPDGNPDNTSPVGPRGTGTVVPDDNAPGGGVDLKITEQFARSMTLQDALNPENLLCYEMNGVPLPREYGFPVRLIAPGWYGVANVKWLTRIEVWDQQYRGNFMARGYVSIREEVRGGQIVWTFASVRHDRLKSAPAKVTRRDGRYRIMGAAWGAPIDRVEVKIDDGPWRRARLERQPSRGRQAQKFAWRFWTLHWDSPAAGEHTITSRAFDVDGNVQPAPDDPYLAGKVTFWESNGQITRRVLIPS